MSVARSIDFQRDLFPFCIVWTPIPLLTWLFPFVGHLGIGDSQGVIHDFAGPYFIGKGNMAFGRPARYLQMDPQRVQDLVGAPNPEAAWDRGIQLGDEVYRHRMHNLCCDNCHSHVARCLNEISFDGSRNWNMVMLAAKLFFKGTFVSTGHLIATFAPFVVFLTIILLMTFLL